MRSHSARASGCPHAKNSRHNRMTDEQLEVWLKLHIEYESILEVGLENEADLEAFRIFMEDIKSSDPYYETMEQLSEEEEEEEEPECFLRYSDFKLN